MPLRHLRLQPVPANESDHKMLDKFLTLLTRPEIALAPEDARIALAAVLVEAARADGAYAAAEQAVIEAVLADRHGLDPAAAARLRAEGEAAQARASDLVRFTRAIKQAVPIEDRVAVIEAVWRVIYADGARDHLESALVRQLAGLLYVTDVECGLARQRVAARR